MSNSDQFDTKLDIVLYPKYDLLQNVHDDIL